MPLFPTIADDYDWSLTANLNMFVTACRNRNYMITNGNFGSIGVVSAGNDVSAATWIRSLQQFVENNFHNFCRLNQTNPNQPGGSYGNTTRAGLLYTSGECGSTNNARTYFSTDAGLNISTTPANWWRRKAPGVDSYGAMQAGDYIGAWVWQDLAKAFKALRLFRMTETPEFYAVRQAWLEVPRMQLPPDPPGMMAIAKGNKETASSSMFTVDYDSPRSGALHQYMTSLSGNSYTTGQPDFKVGNYTYERFNRNDGFTNRYRFYPCLASLLAELRWTTTTRWPTGNGDVLAYVMAKLTPNAGRSMWPESYSPHTYHHPPIYEFSGGQYFRKPPSSRGGYAPETSIIQGWNCVYRRSMTNLNTSGILHEANVVDPLPGNFSEWTNYTWSSFGWLQNMNSKEVVGGWTADTADAYYLVDDY